MVKSTPNLGGFMSAYEKVNKILSTKPDISIAEACKLAKVPYYKYSYLKKIALSSPRKKTKGKPEPRMETHLIPSTRTVGKLVAFVGSRSEVVEAVREYLREE